MLWLSAFAATVATQPAGPPVRLQARATVRILSSAPARFAQIEAEQPKRLRSTVIRAADGTSQQARLLEFE